MSIYGNNQVEELIIGTATAAETTLATFIASASDKEVACLSSDGSAVAANKEFKVFQKTLGTASKGLDYEFTQNVLPKNVSKVTVKEYDPEVQKIVTVDGFTGNVVVNTTYAVEVRIYNKGGSLSPEDFDVVTGYYSTGASVAGITDQIIQDGVIDSLNTNLKRRGDSEVTVATATADTFTVTGQSQAVVAGKIVGSAIQFDVTAKQFDDTALIHENLGLLGVTVSTPYNAGSGSGKYAVNLEWFTKGYKYEVYRQTGYPADFGERTPYYADISSTYNAIHIQHFTDRNSPTVETQKQTVTILVVKTDLASNVNTNNMLGDIRTAVGANAIIPADLAVI